MMSFPTISMGEVEKNIENGQEMVLVDLRNRSSFKNCHVRGAINIPFEDICAGNFSLPKDKMLVFYCSRGGQSLMACRYLSQSGYHVVNVANGLTYYHGKYLVRG